MAVPEDAWDAIRLMRPQSLAAAGAGLADRREDAWNAVRLMRRRR